MLGGMWKAALLLCLATCRLPFSFGQSDEKPTENISALETNATQYAEYDKDETVAAASSSCQRLSEAILLESVVVRRCPLASHVNCRRTNYDLDDESSELLSCGRGAEGSADWLPTVHLMNSSSFVHMLTNLQRKASEPNSTEQNYCLLVNFYSASCPFSARLAPAYDALPLLFPRLYVVAIDATRSTRLNHRYGVAATPTVILWHNGRAVSRFDETDASLAALVRLVVERTDLRPEGAISQLLSGVNGSLSAAVPADSGGADFASILLAISFCCSCALYYALRSAWLASLIAAVRRYWYEAIALREHRLDNRAEHANEHDTGAEIL